MTFFSSSLRDAAAREHRIEYRTTLNIVKRSGIYTSVSDAPVYTQKKTWRSYKIKVYRILYEVLSSEYILKGGRITGYNR